MRFAYQGYKTLAMMEASLLEKNDLFNNTRSEPK
jgi:hypothetical protein